MHLNYLQNKLSAKFSITLKYFDKWKLMVLDKIKHAIYNTRIYNKRNLPILKSEINDLNTLKEHFIMSGVDKANNNISFTCKKYYLDNIEHELNNTSTYELSDLTEDDIVKTHIRFCKKFNIDVPDRFLPFVQCTHVAEIS